MPLTRCSSASWSTSGSAVLARVLGPGTLGGYGRWLGGAACVAIGGSGIVRLGGSILAIRALGRVLAGLGVALGGRVLAAARLGRCVLGRCVLGRRIAGRLPGAGLLPARTGLVRLVLRAAGLVLRAAGLVLRAAGLVLRAAGLVLRAAGLVARAAPTGAALVRALVGLGVAS